MPIFFRELVRNRKQFLIWTVILILSSVLILAMFPSISEQAEKYTELLKSSPKAMVSGLGAADISFAKVLDFFSYVIPYITLFASIYAMLLGAGILSKEEDEKTIDFLLAKPVSRSSILSQKYLCMVIYIFLLNFLLTIANYLTIEAVRGKSDYSLKAFLIISIGMFLVHWTFASIGFFLSVFVVRSKSLTPISIGLVLGSYFLSIASVISERLDTLKYFTPFQYINPAKIIRLERIEVVYLIIIFSIIGLMTTGAYLAYNRKSISA